MSNNYTVKTIWAWRKGEDGPELLDAWEEFAVDNNFNGWQEAIKKQSEFVADPDNGFSPLGIRIFDLSFDFGLVEAAFEFEVIEAEVRPG